MISAILSIIGWFLMGLLFPQFLIAISKDTVRYNLATNVFTAISFAMIAASKVI